MCVAFDAAGDHGLKAHGNGWLTTVTLIEGENISPTDSGTANPYVVFTCSGEARTSSVKLRTSHPSWRGKGPLSRGRGARGAGAICLLSKPGVTNRGCK